MYRQSPRGFATKAIHQKFGLEDLSEIVSKFSGSRIYSWSGNFQADNLNENHSEEISRLNKKVAELDDGKYALTFPSGLAAATALFSLLKTGDHLLICNNIYGGTDRIIRDVLIKFEIDSTFLADVSDLSVISTFIKSNTKVGLLFCFVVYLNLRL